MNNIGTEVRDMLQAIRAAAETDAPVAAATACGQAGETMTKMVLTLRSHTIGTPTPAPAGGPPAKISGDLARSVLRTPTLTVSPGIATTAWGSDLIYAAAQEDGATITAKNFPQLGNPTVGFFGYQVTLPKRPFMFTATELLIRSGEFGRIGSKAFAAALDLS